MEAIKKMISRLTEMNLFTAIRESIRNKLLLAFLTLALIPLLILGAIAYYTASSALNQEALDQLEAVETIKTKQLIAWLNDRKGDAAFASNLVVVKGTEGVNEGLPVLSKFKDTPSSPSYAEAFERATNVLGAFANEIGGGVYGDITMIDIEGDVVFALTEGSLNTNIFETQEVAEATFRRALETAIISDIRVNPVHEDEKNMIVAAPVKDSRGNSIGIIVLETKLEVLSGIMQENTGLGETGETYLVGQDKLFRSDSRFLTELNVDTTILNPEVVVDTEAARFGLQGEHGTREISDYRGTQVLSSWSPLVVQEPNEYNPEGVKWIMVAEIDLDEVEEPVVNLAWITGGLVVVAGIIVVVAAFMISGTLVNQVNSIMELFSNIGIGDFEARADVTSTDELGTMASSLNAMLDNILTLIQSQEERDEMQTSIMRLLGEVSDVADGDLTSEAHVTADMTGAIADAFNYMILQLREIISNVQNATLQVSNSAHEIQSTAEQLAQGSENQASQILDTSTAIEDMAVSIQQVSENASLSAEVGQKALINARQGTQAVQNTIEGMNRIRDQVQETAKRIKRLGESSQEIGEIVQLITDIADRTSILALNASIQAAMAGEAGRGFAVVAEEVERLAERSTNATKQIATLTKTIQSETNEAVAAMESTTNEVVSGSQLANQAGQALTEIEAVSNQLAELIQSISSASQQQARGSEAVARSMGRISEVTKKTADGTRNAAFSIVKLASLAEELRGSVSAFKLPTTNGQGA